MKTKLLTALFLLLPLFVYSQNYEKEGDELFAQTQYEQAEKKYKAAIAILGESQTIKQKQDKCTKCKSLLAKAQTAEKESRYSDAAKYYSDLYAIHALPKYQSKVNAMKPKVQQAELADRERQAKIKAESYIHKGTKRIEAKAFYYRSDIKHIVIPEGVTSIGDYAFYGCTSLTSIEFPNSLTSIGDYAFFGCTSLTSIEIPNSVTYIGNYAFYGSRSLTSITIPNSVTSIGSSAFNGCSGLTSVTIGNSVTNIGIYAFSDCTDLTSVTISNSVTSIGEGAFYQCSGLTSITIPNSVTSIGDWAFRYCNHLSIRLPERFKRKVNLSDCKSVTFYSDEKDIQHSTDLKQNHTREEDKIRYTNLSDVDFLKNNDGTVYYPQRKVFVKRLRFNYNLIGSNQYCFITLKSDSDPNYIERFAIPGDQYGKAGNINTLKAKCRCVGNNIYEYTITQVQDAYLYHIQKNVVIGAYEILE